jgi:hypothetical protein
VGLITSGMMNPKESLIQIESSQTIRTYSMYIYFFFLLPEESLDQIAVPTLKKVRKWWDGN